MALTISEERYQQIRAAVMQRHAEKLAEEILVTDWSKQAQFFDVDDFLNFADTFLVTVEVKPRRSRKGR
jgi:hypothetical protein